VRKAIEPLALVGPAVVELDERKLPVPLRHHGPSQFIQLFQTPVLTTT
jgi:hypothetical protein